MAIDRGLVRAAAIAAGVLALVIGLIWALGGFRPALAGGRAVAAGEMIMLQRWTIVVERAAYVDTGLNGLESDPAVRVWLRITNTKDKTLSGLPEGLVAVHIAGVETGAGEQTWGQPRSATFDPDVELALTYDFDWTAGPTPSPQIAVLVRDETERANFIVADNWRATTPAATVRLPCPDDRQRG